MMDERSACSNFNETWSGRIFVCENIKAQKIDDTSQMNAVVVVVVVVRSSILSNSRKKALFPIHTPYIESNLAAHVHTYIHITHTHQHRCQNAENMDQRNHNK